MPPRPTNPRRHSERLLKSMGFAAWQAAAPAPGAEQDVDAPGDGAAPDHERPALLDPEPAGLITQAETLNEAARRERLDLLAADIAACVGCRLCNSRTNTVPGEGNPMAELVFVGEGPGEKEDLQGRPFVGAAGQLLTKIIEAMSFRREEVWIGNCVKCRPPGNRVPEADEMETCLPYLRQQLRVIKPRVIVALGKTALIGLLPEYQKTAISAVRGQWLDYGGVPLMPTFHPSYLLRSPAQKKYVWEDMQKVMAFLGRELPKKPSPSE